MSRTVLCLALAALGSALMPQTASGQSPAPFGVDQGQSAPILTSNRTLFDRLDRIAARSPLWQEAFQALVGSGRRVFVLTPDQVRVTDYPGGPLGPFDPTVLAEVAPVAEADSRVSLVLVVVNLPLIEQIHRRIGSLPGELFADLDRILVHEVYGHALPYLLAGHLSGRCADPAPGERPTEACSVRRENEVRAELRLGRRNGYGLDGLVLAARRQWP